MLKDIDFTPAEKLYCDFVAWTERNLHIERITEEFLQTIIPQAEKFFKLCVLPELLGRWFTRSHGCQVPHDVADELQTEEDNGTWCYCQQPKSGDMICCDSKGCSIRWFHLGCLQMAESPRGKWLCPTCHASNKKDKKSKRKH